MYYRRAEEMENKRSDGGHHTMMQRSTETSPLCQWKPRTPLRKYLDTEYLSILNRFCGRNTCTLLPSHLGCSNFHSRPPLCSINPLRRPVSPSEVMLRASSTTTE